jgi:hypothetical protein
MKNEPNTVTISVSPVGKGCKVDDVLPRSINARKGNEVVWTVVGKQGKDAVTIDMFRKKELFDCPFVHKKSVTIKPGAKKPVGDTIKAQADGGYQYTVRTPTAVFIPKTSKDPVDPEIQIGGTRRHLRRRARTR